MRSDRAPSGTTPTLTLRVEAGDWRWTTTAIWDGAVDVDATREVRGSTVAETSPVAPAMDIGCVFARPFRSGERVGLAADGHGRWVHVYRRDVVARRRSAADNRIDRHGLGTQLAADLDCDVDGPWVEV